MKIKSEKGFTGIDIATSVVLIFIFVSIIATLSYNMNSKAKEIELKSKATEIAVQEIENMKNVDFTTLLNVGINGKDIYTDSNVIQTIPEDFSKKIYVEDYSNINKETEIESNLVKKITVQVEYKFKKNKQVVELSTVISK